jgi:diguanylate cyclase (GGDEF)-like protein
MNEMIKLDPETKTLTRQYFEGSLDLLIVRSKLQGTPLSIVLIELHNFYQADVQRGIECCKSISKLIHKILHRPPDLLARYDTSKFAIALPNSDLMQALSISEKIKQAVYDFLISEEKTDNIYTVSQGICNVSSRYCIV